MSKAKPLLFGAALGASAMFFAQQYHVVHSHDGLQVIPRTPQQTLGLAYADIRTWTPSQWTDRPELARALMAHGSTDLISESVAATLADRVSEDTSTLDELRGFLNGADKSASTDDKLLTFPPLNSGEGVPVRGSDEEGGSELFPIPFPQDARTKPTSDPFRAARSEDNSGAVKSDSGSRFSSDDVLDGLHEAEFKEEKTQLNNGSVINSPKTKSAKSVADHAKEMEDRIFGSSSGSSALSKPSTIPKSTAKTKPSESMFEEVQTQLENRAQEALNRAQESTKEKALSTVESSARDSASYVRNKATEILPDAAKNLIQDGGVIGNEKKDGSSLLDFDPFLE